MIAVFFKNGWSPTNCGHQGFPIFLCVIFISEGKKEEKKNKQTNKRNVSSVSWEDNISNISYNQGEYLKLDFFALFIMFVLLKVTLCLLC